MQSNGYKTVVSCIACLMCFVFGFGFGVSISTEKEKASEIVQNSVQNVDNLTETEEFSETTTEVKSETQTEITTIEEKTTQAKIQGKFMYVTATAYCGCVSCCGKSDGITATGTKATQGKTIAVDPNIIPYGSKVVMNGNTYIAEDCGGFSGNHIDVFFNNHSDALQFGRRTVEIEVKDS